MDLGVLENTCLPQPQTCGVAGGAIAFWMKLDETSGGEGILHGVITSFRKIPMGGMEETGFNIRASGYLG